jgi:phytoene synthase
LLTEADRYYASALQGLQSLTFRSAWAVATALGVYREIGTLVRARGPGAWDRRAVVGGARKLRHGVAGAYRALKAVSLDRWQRSRPRDDGLWVGAGFPQDAEIATRQSVEPSF